MSRKQRHWCVCVTDVRNGWKTRSVYFLPKAQATYWATFLNLHMVHFIADIEEVSLHEDTQEE